jgi:two-component system CheB/CheR fusion protein
MPPENEKAPRKKRTARKEPAPAPDPKPPDQRSDRSGITSNPAGAAPAGAAKAGAKSKPTKIRPKAGDPNPERAPLYIAGIGASAGGLEALQEFLTHMPANSGLAFVVVVHLDPTHRSILTELLQKCTPMAVVQIEDGMTVQPNHVYVIPPNRELGLLHGVLQLMQVLPEDRVRLTIDAFFRYLADDRGDKSIGIILSGGGSDGSLGLRAIKEEGGLVIVQDPETARHSSMPRSALDAGLADYALPPRDMPETLLNYVQRISLADKSDPVEAVSLDALNKIFLLLRVETGHDFSQYRLNTFIRRVNKRMAVHKIEQMSDYVEYLRRYPAEHARLFNEILIGVTQFFREPEAFAAFQKKILPALFKGKSDETALRIWAPGCSTGEEAYTLAMLLHDYKRDHLPGLNIDIFATDANNAAIERARHGQYPASIVADVPEKYLKRYFIKQDHTYLIRPEIREMVVFAQQNLLKDPPFSRLDIISCRNLLIYLKTETQRQVLSLFQYVLLKGGFLFLGPSETIGDHDDYFEAIDRKWRLFRRSQADATSPQQSDFFNAVLLETGRAVAAGGMATTRARLNRREVTEQTLLNHFGAAGILVNDTDEILYTCGPIDVYLKLVPGEARLNILDMLRPGLQVDLILALRQVFNQKETIRRHKLTVNTVDGEKTVDLTVRPVNDPAQTSRLALIIIEERTEPAVQTQASGAVARDEDPRFQELRRELELTHHHLQTTIEELQTTNEEQRSFTEEIQSANEELQSTNEELTTSQEELQSVNEELVTANAEIRSKNEALRRANNDLHNLLIGTDIAIIFLDIDLSIKRFTPAITKLVNLIDTDTGRPLKHTVSNLKYDRLLADAEHVLDTLNTLEREVETTEGRWYNMRIMPYRTVDNVIDGVVLTFGEITPQKKTEAALHHLNEALSRAWDYAQNIVDTLHEGLLILDRELRIESANHSFYRLFGLNPADIEGRLIYELDDGQWDIPLLRDRLGQVVDQDKVFEALEFEHTFAQAGHRKLLLNARQLLQTDGETTKVLLAIEDVTGWQGSMEQGRKMAR